MFTALNETNKGKKEHNRNIKMKQIKNLNHLSIQQSSSITFKQNIKAKYQNFDP